jgi:hypothetical protein
VSSFHAVSVRETLDALVYLLLGASIYLVTLRHLVQAASISTLLILGPIVQAWDFGNGSLSNLPGAVAVPGIGAAI